MGFIYALVDPRNSNVRYIGQTRQRLKERLRAHIKDKEVCHRTNWINSIIAIGAKPQIVLIEEVDENELLDLREIFWIEQYKLSGSNLVNDTNGGTSGYVYTEQVKDKMRAIARKRKSSWNKGKSSWNKNLKMPDDVRRKISMSMSGSKNHNFGKSPWNKGKHK